MPATRTIGAAKAGPLEIREREIRFDGRHTRLRGGRAFVSRGEHSFFRRRCPAPVQGELVFAVHAVAAKQNGESESGGGQKQGRAGSRDRTSFLKQRRSCHERDHSHRERDGDGARSAHQRFHERHRYREHSGESQKTEDALLPGRPTRRQPPDYQQQTAKHRPHHGDHPIPRQTAFEIGRSKSRDDHQYDQEHAGPDAQGARARWLDGRIGFSRCSFGFVAHD